MTAYPPPDPSWMAETTQIEAVPADDRNWGVAANAGSFVTAWFALGLFAPLIVLLLKGDTPWVRRQAVESLNFQLNSLVWIIVCSALMLVLIGFVLLPLYAVFYAACVILASIKASHGEQFHYPLTIRIIS